jgi:hypothetical protein
MFKHLSPHHILLFLALFTTQIQAQKRTFSPLSRYGLGEINQRGSGQSAGLDHTGIALSSGKYLNSLNPASYSSLDSLSFLFDAGVLASTQELSNANGSAKFNNGAFDYMTFGFPVSKHAFVALGLQPFSSTGYKLAQTHTYEDGTKAETNIEGTGNISDVYLGLSIKPFKNFSLGVHASYLFGNLRNLNYSTFPNNYLSVPIAKYRELHVNDLYFDFGMQYEINLNKESSLKIGAIYAPKTNVAATSTSLTVSNFTTPNPNDLSISGDTLESVKGQFINKALQLPQMMGVGVAYQIIDKFIWAADYKFENWSKTQVPDVYTKTTDLWRVSTALAWIPNERNGRHFYQRIQYRLGGHYTNDYLMITDYKTQKDYGLRDYGMSFGFGFPLKRTKSSINLGVEIGKRSTSNSDVLSEKYTKLSLSFTIHEFWFMKNKFD